MHTLVPLQFSHTELLIKWQYIETGFPYNIIGDELLPNFGTKFQAVITCNFTHEITKLPWQPSIRLSAKMATKF